LLNLMYHVPLGSKTATVVLPLAPQSPGTGFQPAPPYWNFPASGAPGPTSVRRYHVPVVGSNMPMPSWPVPVQSPTTGIQPASPNWNGVKLGAPGPSVFLTYHVA